MGDNEKKENPVQEEEGDRESLAPNAATADEVEPVETEVRDALLALTAEVKVISERMGSLQTSQQRVWQCMQENADGQDQLMGRMREVEQRQGNLAQQQRKFQDAQDGRLDEIMRRLSAVEVVQKKRVNEAAGDVVKDGPGGRFGPLPGMSAVSAMPHVSTPVVDDFDADTSDAGVDPQRNVTMRQRKLSHSQRRARDRNLLQEREQEVVLEMDLAETHRKMGVGDSMPTGGWREGRTSSSYGHVEQARPSTVKREFSQARGRRTTEYSSHSWGKRSHDRSSFNLSRLSTSESESEDEDDGAMVRKRSNPQLPKMQTFDGKSSEWGPFIFQFRKMAKAGKWSDREKRDSLLACLRGKAIAYIQSKPKSCRSHYKALRDLLDQRYGMLELPSTARRQLAAMRQEEGESLEDFEDRVMLKTGEGYPGVPEETLQSLATEAFLRGCRDRNAAYATSERKPENLHVAVIEMRDAAANLKAFNRVSVSARQVRFADTEVEEERGREKTRKQFEDKQVSVAGEDPVAVMKYLAELLKKNLGEQTSMARGHSRSPASQQRSRERSPSPGRGGCYNCGQEGHFVRDCPRDFHCYNCGKSGHMSRECPLRGSSQRKSPSRDHQGSDSAESLND